LSDEFEIDNFATINKIYETYAWHFRKRLVH
jgi:hypothetical protein